MVDSDVVVGEDEEVSIKEVADAIVKAVGYDGEYKVLLVFIDPISSRLMSYPARSSTPREPTVNSANLRRIRSC